MEKNIVFIHGMFQNAKSWNKWVTYFTGKGYKCTVESWPLHEGEPSDLRSNIPDGLGKLKLEEVIQKYESIIYAQNGAKPILIGHSVGGLIVQILASKGYASAGIAISSVAPNRMLALDWGLFKNSLSIANPFVGDDPVMMSPEGFHENFCNTMSEADSNKAYEETATHDSRNVFRDCLSDVGKIDVTIPHVPMLLIGGEKDQIIPPDLNKKNKNAYTDKGSVIEFKEFPNRGHWICGQQNWEEVAEYSASWLESIKTEIESEQTEYKK